MPTTFDLRVHAMRIIDQLNDPEGAPASVEDEIKEFVASSTNKLAALYAVHRALGDRSDILESEAKAFAAAAKRVDAQRAKVADMATALMLDRVALGEPPKVQGPGFSASLATTESVVVDPGTELPERFCRITIEPARSAIKVAILSGEDVPGCHIAERVSVRFRSVS